MSSRAQLERELKTDFPDVNESFLSWLLDLHEKDPDWLRRRMKLQIIQEKRGGPPAKKTPASQVTPTQTQDDTPEPFEA